MAGTGAGGVDPEMLKEDLSTPPAIDDTQAAPEPTTPATDDSGNVGQQTQSEEKPDDAKIQAALREYGKLSQTQADLKKEREEKEQLKADLAKKVEIETRYRNIEREALKTPEKYKRALEDYSGYTTEQAQAEVERMKAQGTWKEQTQTVPVGSKPLTKEEIEAIADARYEQRVSARDLQSAFFAELPQLDPKNVAEEDKPSVQTLMSAVEFEARRRLAEAGKTLSVDNLAKESVVVYKKFTGISDEQLQKIREEGRIQGALEKKAEKVSTSKSPQGFTPKETNFGLSAAEIAQAEAEGISLEMFARLKDPIAQA